MKFYTFDETTYPGIPDEVGPEVRQTNKFCDPQLAAQTYREHLEEWTADQDHLELMGLLQSEGVPAGAVHDQRELYENPQMVARGYFEQLEQPSTGKHPYTGMMWKMADTPNGIRRPAPMLGEHNKYVFKELLGLPETEYVSLKQKGHVGTEYSAHLYK